MGHWSGVLRAFDDLVRDEAQARERRERAERTNAKFVAWCELAEEQVLHDIEGALKSRAAELHERFGVTVDVQYPSDPTLVTQGGGRMRFLRVSLGIAEVHAYSTRDSGELPMIHYAHAVRAPRARFARLISVPGFMVRRGPDDEAVLMPCGRPIAEPLSPDDVACRILSMLAAATRAQSNLPS